MVVLGSTSIPYGSLMMLLKLHSHAWLDCRNAAMKYKWWEHLQLLKLMQPPDGHIVLHLIVEAVMSEVKLKLSRH